MTTYPYISYEIFDSNENVINTFLPIELSLFRIDFTLNSSETKSEPIYVSDLNLIVKVFDNNINLIKEDDGYYLAVLREGTCQIGAYYNDTFIKFEVLVYGSFFKDNYLDNFLNNYDRKLLNNNTRVKVMFDTYAEFIDIIFAYVHDVDDIDNPLDIKKKFLLSLSNSMGFNDIQYISEGRNIEYKMDIIYRELLSNLVTIAQTRGTKLSYELFFGSLGFDIDLLEFWFDSDGNLIEINADDNSLSSFQKYSLLGLPLTSDYKDPRSDLSFVNEYNKNMKSNYIMPIISLKDNYDSDLLSEQQSVLLDFLDLLKPKHINYLIQIFKANIVNLFDSSKTEEILNYLWGEIYQLKPISDKITLKNYGTSWIKSTYDSIGLTYEFKFIEDGSIIIESLGVPDFLNFEEISDTDTYIDGIIYNNDEDPYANSPVTYDETNNTVTSINNAYVNEYSSDVDYEEEDFSDDQDPIVAEDSDEKSTTYYEGDVIYGDCFGTIGAEYAATEVEATIIEDDLSQEEESEESIVSILNSTNSEISDESSDDSSDEIVVINSDGTLSTSANITYLNGYIYPYVYENASPCDISHNNGILYYGTWDWDKYPRGTFVEKLIKLNDEIIVSVPFEIYDILQEPMKYDTKDANGNIAYKYDGDLDLGQPIDNPSALASEQLYYDSGVLLNYTFTFIDTTSVILDYYILKNKVDNDTSLDEQYIIDSLVSKYGISENDYYNIRP